MVLACVMLVAAAGACQASAFFDSMTSMFTAVALPQGSHYQANGLTNGAFLKDSLNLIPQDSSQSTSADKVTSNSIQDLMNMNLKPSTEKSPSSGIYNYMLTPGVNESQNPVGDSYKGFLKKYTNSTWNVFDD